MNPSFPRLTGVELRKMVDTRAGFWLQLIVAVLTLAAVVLVCIFAPTDELVFRDLFALAITPASILLPIVGILLVSSEWSQRTALITFTLVPQRMRVMGAKVAAGVALGLVVAALAFVVAVIANLAVGDEWTMGFAVFGQIIFLLLVSILGGIAFGAAFLSSAPAIVLSFALPLAWSALGFIPWLDDARGLAGHDPHHRAVHRGRRHRDRVGPARDLAGAVAGPAAGDRPVARRARARSARPRSSLAAAAPARRAASQSPSTSAVMIAPSISSIRWSDTVCGSSRPASRASRSISSRLRRLWLAIAPRAGCSGSASSTLALMNAQPRKSGRWNQSSSTSKSAARRPCGSSVFASTSLSNQRK